MHRRAGVICFTFSRFRTARPNRRINTPDSSLHGKMRRQPLEGGLVLFQPAADLAARRSSPFIDTKLKL